MLFLARRKKGNFQTGYLCSTLAELESRFGNPPAGTRGLYFAIQSLLFHYQLIFFRVEEEGFSLDDYKVGLRALAQSKLIHQVLAIGLPGVGDKSVIEAATPLIRVYHQILITSESDLYDLYTASR